MSAEVCKVLWLLEQKWNGPEAYSLLSLVYVDPHYFHLKHPYMGDKKKKRETRPIVDISSQCSMFGSLVSYIRFIYG